MFQRRLPNLLGMPIGKTPLVVDPPADGESLAELLRLQFDADPNVVVGWQWEPSVHYENARSFFETVPALFDAWLFVANEARRLGEAPVTLAVSVEVGFGGTSWDVRFGYTDQRGSRYGFICKLLRDSFADPPRCACGDDKSAV